MKNKYEIHLISEELLKQYSSISRNTSIDKVYPYIALVEDFYISDLLGEPLMDELKEQIAVDKLTPANKSLIVYIAPVIALYTEAMALRSLAYSITEKGITKERSENSESISEKELGQWKVQLERDAERARERLIRYLCECNFLYPLWKPLDGCLCAKYKPTNGSTKKAGFGMIYLPTAKGKCACVSVDHEPLWVIKKVECLTELYEKSGQYGNTGVLEITWVDENTQSESYKKKKVEQVEDTEHCPLPDTDPDWEVYSTECMTEAYEPSGVFGNNGFKRSYFRDENPFSETYSDEYVDDSVDEEECPLPDTDPEWTMISSICEQKDYNE